MRIQMHHPSDYIPSTTHKYIPEDKKRPSDGYAANSEENLFVTFVMTNDEFETIKSLEPKFVIDATMTIEDDDEFISINNGVFHFIYSEEHATELANAPDFYPDKLTTDNMARKEMIFEDTDFNVTKEVGELTVTVEGIQVANLELNEASKESFKNFGDNDLIAVTTKINIDNQSEHTIWNNTISSRLLADGGDDRINSQGMIETYSPDKIEPNESGDRYQVFIIRKKFFEIYETFSMTVRGFRNDEGSLYDGEELEFELPNLNQE